MQYKLGLRLIASAAAVAAMMVAQAQASEDSAASGGYEDLLSLFTQWRAFEQPPDREGAPDYTAATIAQRHDELKSYQQRLAAINPGSWPVEQQVDYQIVRAEMNGMDFNIRVLQPWARDPAFYTTVWTEQSDTPAHEGPTHHALVEIWTYAFPLSSAAETKLTAELATIPPLLNQARGNLTGNAHDLWVSGTGTMRQQARDLTGLAVQTTRGSTALKHAVAAALKATTDFADWLDALAVSKAGPSGVGKENYTWNLRNVHLVPSLSGVLRTTEIWIDAGSASRSAARAVLAAPVTTLVPVRVTMTPEIPGSPVSFRPLPFVSSKTAPPVLRIGTSANE